MDERVLVETQKSVLSVLLFQPLSISLLLKPTDKIIERFNLVFLPHKVRSCLIAQMIFIAFEERFFFQKETVIQKESSTVMSRGKRNKNYLKCAEGRQYESSNPYRLEAIT